MSRRQAPITPRMLQGPPRRWPPTCAACGWSGEPGPDASPYVACGGDPSRYRRRLAPAACTATGGARHAGACLAGPGGGCSYCGTGS